MPAAVTVIDGPLAVKPPGPAHVKVAPAVGLLAVNVAPGAPAQMEAVAGATVQVGIGFTINSAVQVLVQVVPGSWTVAV